MNIYRAANAHWSVVRLTEEELHAIPSGDGVVATNHPTRHFWGGDWFVTEWDRGQRRQTYTWVDLILPAERKFGLRLLDEVGP
jgi:hypothetical protein